MAPSREPGRSLGQPTESGAFKSNDIVSFRLACDDGFIRNGLVCVASERCINSNYVSNPHAQPRPSVMRLPVDLEFQSEITIADVPPVTVPPPRARAGHNSTAKGGVWPDARPGTQRGSEPGAVDPGDPLHPCGRRCVRQDCAGLLTRVVQVTDVEVCYAVVIKIQRIDCHSGQ